jgi:energy-coupling factor transporter ATP-binding protein EcfA2
MKFQATVTIIALAALLLGCWYIDHIVHDDLVVAARWLVVAVIAGVVLAVVGVLSFGSLIFTERLLKERASRKLAEREAQVMCLVAEEGQQVYIRDTNNRATWRNAHLDMRVYANGQLLPPDVDEIAAWQTYTLRHRPLPAHSSPPLSLPAQTQVDLLAALDNVQRCLIVGASDSGKTTLLQWLIYRRLHTSKVIVIDPHAYPDKWRDGVVVGAGRNYAEIERALEALVRLMTKRYDEIGQGIVVEQGHPRITILIDEWRAIVYNVKTASDAIKALLTESRKAAFSVFVATHSDRAKPLGLEGEYDLKDGFAVVRPSMIGNQRQATLDMGTGEAPVSLPGPYVTQPQPVIDADELINLAPKPTQEEAEILRLFEEGKSISAVAAAVFGSKGGNQNQRVKETLQKYGGVEV